MSEQAVCARCRNCAGQWEPWYRWRCLAFPRRATWNPVTGDTVADPPHERCKDRNPAGYCEAFDPLPDGQARKAKYTEEKING